MITEIDTTKCTGCGICFSLCPLDVLRLDTSREEAPPCGAFCPAGVDIRGFIYLLKLGFIGEAAKLVREALPIPAVTGRICFHPCETECARKAVDESVNINALERFVADYWLKEKAERVPRQHVGKVAIVGSGPAGLAAAYDLIKMGYPVTVFESMTQPGGMLRIGIPAYRLPRDILNSQIRYIRDMGVDFKMGVTIGKDISIQELKDKGYRAIFIAVGAHKDLNLGIPGEGLDCVYHGLTFLKHVNSGMQVRLGEKVVIIGGGNVAIDAARTAIRLGAKEVNIVYRRGRKQITAFKECITDAENEGVNFIYLAAPTRIMGEDSKVNSIECVKTELRAKDTSDKKIPVPAKGSEFLINADTVIVAIGEVPDTSLGDNKNMFDLTPESTLKVNPVNLSTDIPGVFAGGDAVSSPSSVVEAIASGKRAAISIDLYLKAGREKEVKKVEKVPREGVDFKARQMTHLLPLAERSKDFRELRLGFNEEMATMEAERCMTCGSKAYIAYPEDCMTCFKCELKCPYEAIDVHPFKEVLPFTMKF